MVFLKILFLAIILHALNSCKTAEEVGANYESSNSIREYWESILLRTHTDAQKQAAYSEVVVGLAARGRMSEALQLIQTTFYKSELRSELVAKIFGANEVNFSQAVTEYSKLEATYDRADALLGIAVTISRMETHDDLSVVEIEKLGSTAAQPLVKDFVNGWCG